MGPNLAANKIARFFKMRYLKEEVNDELYFCMHINIEVF